MCLRAGVSVRVGVRARELGLQTQPAQLLYERAWRTKPFAQAPLAQCTVAACVCVPG